MKPLNFHRRDPNMALVRDLDGYLASALGDDIAEAVIYVRTHDGDVEVSAHLAPDTDADEVLAVIRGELEQ